MSTDLVHAPSSDLAITGEQKFWTDKQKAALAQLGVANASNADLAVFFHQVVRTGLDPFLKQIYMIERDGKQTIQTGIDGFRLIARRAVDKSRETLGYEDTLWCGADGEWKRVWLESEPPHAAAVVALRNGNRFPAIALYNEYVIVRRDGKPNRTWANRPAGQLEKCAEALALRKAFPQDLSGLYTSDEMKADSPPEATWDAEVVEEKTEVEGQEFIDAFPGEGKP
jgi:phage recombination protein Bet